MESRKRKRIVLEPSRKLEIVKYANEHPKASQQDVANYFSVLWDYPVNRRTVGDILARREKWQDTDSCLLSPAEFVSVDSDVPTAESISDEDIISYVTSASETDDDPDDIDPPPPPSTKDVNNAVDVLQRFIEHSRHSLPSDIDMHRALHERILALQTMSARQAKITDFMM